MSHKVLLIVLDGVGEYRDYPGNAVTQAVMPFFDSLYANYPWTLLKASGNAVGVPEGVQGASEPGHLIMGAGRVVFQPLEEINQAIQHGRFENNPVYQQTFDFIKKHDSTLHLIGMISDGGVHSHIDHLLALLQAAKNAGIQKVLVHGITDGRDVPEQSAAPYIEQILETMNRLGTGRLATLIGRYYAMDRDTNFDRTRKAYDLYTQGAGSFYESPFRALEEFYAAPSKDPVTDYYLPPTRLIEDSTIREGDGVIFFNFRSDRARQLSSCFSPEDFTHFERQKELIHGSIFFACTGPYSDTLPVAFPPQEVKNNLGSWLSGLGKKQIRIAETEKYAHVTYFFNSQIEAPEVGEDRVMVPSPKVASYAEAPQMNAQGVADSTVEALKSGTYDFILVNFANGDLVGHSGVYTAAKLAMETIDGAVKQTITAALENGYAVIMTADHGNAEYMTNPDGSQNPSHTLNLVRCVIATPEKTSMKLKEGQGLSSIAPTVLQLMELPIPPEMGAGLL